MLNPVLPAQVCCMHIEHIEDIADLLLPGLGCSICEPLLQGTPIYLDCKSTATLGGGK